MEGLTTECYLTCKVLNETLKHGLVNTWLNPNSHSPPGQTLTTRPKDFIPKPNLSALLCREVKSKSATSTQIIHTLFTVPIQTRHCVTLQSH